MLTSYYSLRGSLVLFDNVKNRVVDQNNKRLFPATPARVEFLVSMGTLQPVCEAHAMSPKTLSPVTEATTIQK